MKDRIPTYPGRVKLTPVAGQANVYDMVRADEPVEAGTPLNKATLLTDQTATKLGLTPDTATPDKAFEMLANKMIDKLVFVKIKQSTTWTAPKAVNQLFKVFAVGGGGGGGYRGGGGGSGYLTIETRTITENTPVEIVCGAGGKVGTEDSTKGIDGGQTSFGDIIALGGKGGGNDGGDGLAGGGGSYDGKGGDGAFGGGGGGGGHTSKGQGGNGGTYGGGGGGGYYDPPNNGGIGGTYGGNGGASKQNGENGYTFNDTYLNILFNTAAIQQGLAGEGVAYSNDSGGGGGGGYGGNGASVSRYQSAGGGGGGYCGNVGNAYDGGGGGGGYCGNGGNAAAGNPSCGGGGGGFFSDGGQGDNGNDYCGGGGGGFFHDGGRSERQDEHSEQYNNVSGLGGNGGVLIMYFKED